jgi:hypothetical protein
LFAMPIVDCLPGKGMGSNVTGHVFGKWCQNVLRICVNLWHYKNKTFLINLVALIAHNTPRVTLCNRGLTWVFCRPKPVFLRVNVSTEFKSSLTTKQNEYGIYLTYVSYRNSRSRFGLLTAASDAYRPDKLSLIMHVWTSRWVSSFYGIIKPDRK